VLAHAIGVLPLHDQSARIHAELRDDVAELLELQFAELREQTILTRLTSDRERVELGRGAPAGPFQTGGHVDEVSELRISAKPAESSFGKSRIVARCSQQSVDCLP